MPPRPSIWASVKFAWAGVRHGFATQRNLRVQAAVGVLVLLLACLLRLPASQIALLTALGTLVLCAELMNTVVEDLLDYTAGTEFDPGVKRLKDLSAASVLILCVGAAVVGATILLPRLASLGGRG